MNLDAIQGEDEILSVLHAAQERIRDPENWCQGHLYQTRNGKDQWCATGSFELAKTIGEWTSAWGLLWQAANELGHDGIVTLNNQTDHATVMAMFDRAQELRLADMLEAAVT